MTTLVHAERIEKPRPDSKVFVVYGKPWDMAKHPKATFIDHFAGLGGATEGGKRALQRLGYKVGETLRIITVNHDPDAVANHALNHPDAEHHCCPLETLEPRLAYLGHVCDECKDLVVTTPCPVTGSVGERVTLLSTCAPCQEYSQANQKVYSRPQMRATPDFSRRWRQILRPLVVIEENVPRIRKVWKGWKAHLRSYDEDGYRHEHKVLNAADYGTPQERRRLIHIAIARDWFGDHEPIPWAKKTHSKHAREAGTLPWMPVLPCIDFEEPTRSFFDGRQNTGEPYAQNVRDRLARYIRTKGRFYEVLARAVETFSGRVPLREALDAVPESEWPTWIAREEGDRLILTAERFLVHQLPEGECRALNEPSYSQLTAAYHRLAEIRCVLPLRGPRGGETANKAYAPEERPGHAQTTRGGGYLAEGRVLCLLPGGGSGAPVRDVNQPGNAVTHGGAWLGEVQVRMSTEDPVILPHHGERDEQLPRYHDTRNPSPAVPASRRFDVAFPVIVTYHGRNTDTRAAARAGPTIATKNQHYAAYPVVVVDIDDLWLDLAYRQFTVREVARIQGFDDTLQLTGSITAIQRGLGNAVPPPLFDACLTSVFQMRGIRKPTLDDYAGGSAA